MMRVLLLAVACLFLRAGPCALANEPTSDGLYAAFSTSLGEFWCRLEFERAPRTVANFVGLVEGNRPWIDLSTATIVQKRFYDGLTFHRVVDKFIIQGGSPNGRGTDGPGFQFADEFHAQLKHSKAGILSMANSGKNSNGSQFFITVTNTPWLDGVHSVFGSVVEGMETVFTISKVPANTNSQPLTPVIMNQVRILRRGAAAESFDPAMVVPPLPDVGQVPISLRRTSNDLELLFQSRAGHFTYIFVTSNFSLWGYGVSRNSLTNLQVSAFLGVPYQSYSEAFFRSLDGGFEP